MLEFAIEIARRAGALLVEGLQGQPQIELKSPFEVVTDMDRASEQLIVSAIRAEFPNHAILAEEGGGAFGAAQPTWLIDPLDGTNNYAHGFPYFAVSVALWADDQPQLGVVFDPLRGEMFSAAAGRGAYCNERRIHASQVATLGAALVSTGFPYDYGNNPSNNLREFDRIQARCQGVRRAGAAALDLAYIAIGRLDAHWEYDLKPWDTAAGVLLVLEAGGRLSNERGQPWRFADDWLIASNGHIHDELLQGLSHED
jgi:myo-inositol-1(or 4)-monophosphatase